MATAAPSAGSAATAAAAAAAAAATAASSADAGDADGLSPAEEEALLREQIAELKAFHAKLERSRRESTVGWLMIDVLEELIDHQIKDVAFEVHRQAKLGLICPCTRPNEHPVHRGLVSIPGLDIFGLQPYKTGPASFPCPNCGQLRAPAKFAPHLEKCLGVGGRESRRVAVRRQQQQLLAAQRPASAAAAAAAGGVSAADAPRPPTAPAAADVVMVAGSAAASSATMPAADGAAASRSSAPPSSDSSIPADMLAAASMALDDGFFLDEDGSTITSSGRISKKVVGVKRKRE